ncbi:MAG: hypothetical protein AAF597_12525 [Bacteroidota bacterium]
MKIEEYYAEHYPDGEPWEELTKEQQRAVRRERRRESWENFKDTLENITDVLDFIVMIFGRRK